MVHLDQKRIETSEYSVQKSKMPASDLRVLREKLLNATTSVHVRPHPDLEHIDNAFFKILLDPEESEHQIDDIEVRDAFL